MKLPRRHEIAYWMQATPPPVDGWVELLPEYPGYFGASTGHLRNARGKDLRCLGGHYTAINADGRRSSITPIKVARLASAILAARGEPVALPAWESAPVAGVEP